MPLSLLLGEDKKNAQRKFRTGYEDNAGALISKKVKAADFIKSEDPVRVLTEATELVLQASSNDEETSDETDAFIASHPATTAEIKLLCADIKVLGKGDFKHLIKWRLAVLKDLKKLEKASAAKGEIEDEEEKDASSGDEKEGEEEDENEIELGKAMLSLEERRKKEEKRMRKQQAKLQRHKDQGLIHPFAYDLADQDVPFSIKSLGLTSTKDARLDVFREGERVNRPVQQDDEDEDEDENEPEESYSDLIEKQLEADYERYSRRKELNAPMTVQERRRQLVAEKKAKKKKSALERMTEEDFQRALEEAKLDAYNKGAYAKMLRKGTLSKQDRDEEDEDGSSSSSDDDENESLNHEDEEQQQHDDDEEEENDDESKQRLIERAKAKRWFEQQVFHDPVLMEDEEEDDDDSIDPESIPLPRDLLDKEKRKVKRKKEEERKERKRLRKEKQDQASLGDVDELPIRKTKKDVEIVPSSSSASSSKQFQKDEDGEGNDYDFDEDDAREQLKNKRELDPKIKTLIEKGMGKLKSDASSSSKNNNKIEVVKNNKSNKRSKLDSDEDSDTENLVEAYNSDDYDSDERAEHLALGAMLAKKSTRSAVLDAAYNRYAFNDDSLPAWFAEDESRHNRPNLPVTREMVESVKARFSDMNDRPIKKVAEARMRKKKRAVKKLEDAKRKAAAIVEEPDLSGRSKIRTIEKLFKGATVKRPGSVYVVSQKGGSKKTAAGGGKGGKGAKVKVVDPRLKKDMRAQKRKDGKGKGGGGKRKKHR